MAIDVERWLRKDGQNFLKEIGVRTADVILDFGCQNGHYTIPAAKIVGRKGRVYALEKEGEALDKLIQIVKKEGLENVIPVKTKGELKTSFEDKSMDVVLLYDVLHFIDKRGELYREVYRILKTGALLSVYPRHHKLDKDPLMDIGIDKIIKEIEKADFYLDRKFFKRLIHDNSYEKGYILNFRRKLCPNRKIR